jgi:hypothetical protein
MQSMWIVWGAVGVAAAVGFALLVRTRWLQSHTLSKCVLLSVLLHAVLALVCAIVGGVRPASWGLNDEGRMSLTVALSTDPADDEARDSPVPPDAEAEPRTVEPPAVVAVEAGADQAAVVPPAESSGAAEPPPLLEVAAVDPESPAPRETPAPTVGDTPETGAALALADGAAVANAAPQPAPAHAVPDAYADRADGRRAVAAAARGGSEATERAVQAALAWLVAAQSRDGRWSAAQHGAGVERSVQGQHRQGAGARSDHGVTGLALLAFLGAGQTHCDGPHAESVRRGIDFLVARQRADGSLAGEAEFFAALYCHGMATIALAECAALTGDPRLGPPLDRAVRHTLAMQNLTTGGWRYAAGDRGDTSQLGWQLMVLSSARNAGLGGLEPAEARARHFLTTVSSGTAGGLAAYRPGERPSLTMTAEGAFCRQLLGAAPDDPAVCEALDLIARSPPDRGRPNAYTWYYATLASFHAGGRQWDQWNARLQEAVLPLQRSDGSWDPDPVWGGHGGRVYATALSAMTLEVYYRHLPMHRQPRRIAAAR